MAKLANLQVGDRVTVGQQELLATVKFLGPTEFATGEWLGLELDEQAGKNDGSVKGKRYFESKPEHGIFVRPTAVTKVQAAEVLPPPSLSDGLPQAPRGLPGSVDSPSTSPKRPSRSSGSASPATPLEKPKRLSQRVETQASRLEATPLEKPKRSSERSEGQQASRLEATPLEKPKRSSERSEGQQASHLEATPLEKPKRSSERSEGQQAQPKGFLEDRDEEVPLPKPLKQRAVEVQKAEIQLELAHAMEDHDLDTIKRCLPLAAELGLDPKEITAAKCILRYEVQQDLFEEVDTVRNMVFELADAMAKLQDKCAALCSRMGRPQAAHVNLHTSSAAEKIQACHRGYVVREQQKELLRDEVPPREASQVAEPEVVTQEAAAGKIQAVYRGCMVRNQAEFAAPSDGKAEDAAIQEACSPAEKAAQEEEAALRIQSVYRGGRDRKAVKAIAEEETRAAAPPSPIAEQQANGFHEVTEASSPAEKAAQEEEAALRIQSVYRGGRDRKAAPPSPIAEQQANGFHEVTEASSPAEKAAQEEEAALRIQSVYRGGRDRKVVKAKAEEETRAAALPSPEQQANGFQQVTEATSPEKAVQEEDAALRIQSVYRGRRERKAMKTIADEEARAVLKAMAEEEVETSAAAPPSPAEQQANGFHQLTEVGAERENGPGAMTWLVFSKAIAEASPGTSISQAKALFDGACEGTGRDAISPQLFSDMIQALHMGDEAASQFADLHVEDYRALGR